MTTNKPHTQINPEKRWSIGAWATVLFVLGMLLWQVVTSVGSLAYPSDGWNYNATNELVNQLRLYPLDTPTPLQVDDRVIAIEGQAWDPLKSVPLPETVRVGQVLRYTVQRGDQTFEYDVTLIQRPLRSILIGLLRSLERDPLGHLINNLSLAIALAVFVLRPGNLAARYMLIAFGLLAISQLGLTGSLGPYVWRAPSWIIASEALGGTAWGMVFFPTLMLLALSFPTVKTPLRRFPRALPALIYGVPNLLALPGIVEVATERQSLTLGVSPLLFLSFFVPMVGFLAVVIGTVVLGFARERDPVMRAQLRWAAVGLGGSYGVLVLGFIGTSALGLDAELRGKILNVAGLCLILFPVCLGIAILRYRLWDIDIIIRRTLIYSVLTGALAVLFFGGVTALQQLFVRLTGQQSDFAIVASTLLIAALALPLRNRVQNAIDRRFYRKKYDAQKVLEAFAAKLQDASTDEQSLAQDVQAVIQETLQPRMVKVWLVEDAKNRSSASAGEG